MKVYLSVPIIPNRALGRAKIMAKAITDSGHEVTSPWVLGGAEKPYSSSPNVFDRDRSGVETSDALVADVSEPSIGVGMEIMAAYKANHRIIIVAKKGRVLSRMLDHMVGKETLEYGDENEIYDGLVRLLK